MALSPSRTRDWLTPSYDSQLPTTPPTNDEAALQDYLALANGADQENTTVFPTASKGGPSCLLAPSSTLPPATGRGPLLEWPQPTPPVAAWPTETATRDDGSPSVLLRQFMATRSPSASTGSPSRNHQHSTVISRLLETDGGTATSELPSPADDDDDVDDEEDEAADAQRVTSTSDPHGASAAARHRFFAPQLNSRHGDHVCDSSQLSQQQQFRASAEEDGADSDDDDDDTEEEQAARAAAQQRHLRFNHGGYQRRQCWSGQASFPAGEGCEGGGTRSQEASPMSMPRAERRSVDVPDVDMELQRMLRQKERQAAHEAWVNQHAQHGRFDLDASRIRTRVLVDEARRLEYTHLRHQLHHAKRVLQRHYASQGLPAPCSPVSSPEKPNARPCACCLAPPARQLCPKYRAMVILGERFGSDQLEEAVETLRQTYKSDADMLADLTTRYGPEPRKIDQVAPDVRYRNVVDKLKECDEKWKAVGFSAMEEMMYRDNFPLVIRNLSIMRIFLEGSQARNYGCDVTERARRDSQHQAVLDRLARRGRLFCEGSSSDDDSADDEGGMEGDEPSPIRNGEWDAEHATPPKADPPAAASSTWQFNLKEKHSSPAQQQLVHLVGSAGPSPVPHSPATPKASALLPRSFVVSGGHQRIGAVNTRARVAPSSAPPPGLTPMRFRRNV